MSDDTLPTHYDAKRRRSRTSVWQSRVSSTFATDPCPSIADFNVSSSIHTFNTLYRVSFLSFYQINDSKTSRYAHCSKVSLNRGRCSKGSNSLTDRLQFPTLWFKTFAHCTLQVDHFPVIKISRSRRDLPNKRTARFFLLNLLNQQQGREAVVVIVVALRGCNLRGHQPHLSPTTMAMMAAAASTTVPKTCYELATVLRPCVERCNSVTRCCQWRVANPGKLDCYPNNEDYNVVIGRNNARGKSARVSWR